MRRGRRAGSSGTRQAVLEAARSRFAEDGYAATTIRRIAADAEVDAALVIQFYRSKEELFAAGMSLSPAGMDRLASAFDGPADGIGERAVRTFLEVWEGPSPDSDALIGMMRAAVSGEVKAYAMRDYFQARLVEEISPRIRNHPDGVVRAGVVASMLVGLVLGRRIVQVPALDNREDVVRVAGAAVQAVLG